ncbi:MAG: hypothetical protein BJ554DRAFT_4681, partial [Olpidium bornovanus]
MKAGMKRAKGGGQDDESREGVRGGGIGVCGGVGGAAVPNGRLWGVDVVRAVGGVEGGVAGVAGVRDDGEDGVPGGVEDEGARPHFDVEGEVRDAGGYAGPAELRADRVVAGGGQQGAQAVGDLVDEQREVAGGVRQLQRGPHLRRVHGEGGRRRGGRGAAADDGVVELERLADGHRRGEAQCHAGRAG